MHEDFGFVKDCNFTNTVKLMKIVLLDGIHFFFFNFPLHLDFVGEDYAVSMNASLPWF